MKSYEEVGKSVGLNSTVLKRYIAYMKRRWKDTEIQKCSDGYAREWARRFKAGIEYNASDSEGQAILIEQESFGGEDGN